MDFGINKLSYRVLPLKEGCIVVEVHHDNQGMRREIERHRDDPKWFLRLLAEKQEGSRARQHLRDAVRKYERYFREGEVTFIAAGEKS